jgi:cytochrome c-type biogenesis protein
MSRAQRGRRANRISRTRSPKPCNGLDSGYVRARVPGRALTTWSPCVLSLVPILVASALAAHRLGVVALAAGLGVSFSVIGIFVASIGASLGVDGELFRRVAAVLMIPFGLAMFSQRLRATLNRAAAGMSSPNQNWLSRIKGDTLSGQFAVGLLLGAAWSPCVGPTLGAATTLAA